MPLGGPVDADSRIGELDVIRGFALFGVLWMNLFELPGYLFPNAAVIELAPHPVEAAIGFASIWLMIGKAQALFSMLFGFGFALFLARAERAGRDGTRLYLRRVGFLLVLGFAHALLLWPGDILNAYAMMGLLLILTRRWPGWLLIVGGVSLALLTVIVNRLIWEHLIASPGTPIPYRAMMEAGAVRRMPVFLGHDYLAFVRENVRGLFDELYFTSFAWAFLGWIMGRFLIGAWFYRRGWLQNAGQHAAGFRRWAAILIPAGLALAAIAPAANALSLKPVGEWQLVPFQLAGRGSQLVLGLGYAAGLIVLLQSARWQNRLSGLASAGRMALTNYLTQSLLYFFLLYGLGAGLLRYTAPSFALMLAVIFYAGQIAFSRWWLRRYRFGPAEWVWRSWTYDRWQPMRRL